MRRHTMKQPSGPGSERDTDAARERASRRSRRTPCAQLCFGGRRSRLPGGSASPAGISSCGQYRDCGRDRGCRPRDAAAAPGPNSEMYSGMSAHRLRLAGTADVPVDAHHAVGRAQHEVEVVGDDQHAAAAPIPQAGRSTGAWLAGLRSRPAGSAHPAPAGRGHAAARGRAGRA